MKNIALFSLILLLTFTPKSWAQDSDTSTDFTAGSDISFSTDKAIEAIKAEEVKKAEEQAESAEAAISTDKNAESTIVEDKYAGLYETPSIENLSKLYWKMNNLDIKNDLVVDNFMRINECDIFTKFYTDDFEWVRVREAGRNMIKENKDSFSTKIQMIVPIDFGRYDMQRKGFPLISKTAFKELRRIELGGNSNNTSICGKQGNIAYYPRNLILILNKPFSYDFVKLDEHIAQAFIIRRKYNKAKLTENMRMEGFERPAYARVRFTISKYQGEAFNQDRHSRAVMFGQLDGIDIFEDAHQQHLLTSLDYQKGSKK